MFNPQRKSKVSDIYMQQKTFQLHLQKLGNIRRSNQPRSQRYQSQQTQKRYLDMLKSSKQQVKERMDFNISRDNHKLFTKLVAADRRSQEYFQGKSKSKKKHFNSYFINRKEDSRIKQENCQLYARMMQLRSAVPALQQLKKEFKQSKRYSKMVRKLPAILKHEEGFRKELSGMQSYREQNSKTSLRTSRKESKAERSSVNLPGRPASQLQKELTNKNQ